MPLFEMTREDLVECKPVTFAHLEIKEREGLQHVLRDHIDGWLRAADRRTAGAPR